MNRYKIADLIVDIEFRGELSKCRSEKYKIEYDASTAPDFVIDIPEETVQKVMEDSGVSDRFDEFEYLMTGTRFYRHLIRFDGFFLHSSAVVLDGYAYLFSAPCGTGKSTHTSLWKDYFKDHNAYIINDDKPALKLSEDGRFYVYGTPWSGKHDINVNACVPLGAICFLERSETNHIEKLSAPDALTKLVWQTVRPRKEEDLTKLLSHYDKLIQKYDIYSMGCTIDFEAVKLAYNAMKSKEIENED